MADLELVGLPAQSEPHDLVAETNSEDRFVADEPLYVLLGIRNRVGIVGTIGEKDPVRIHGQDIFGGRAGGNDSYSATRLGEVSENVVFDIVLVGDDDIGRGFESSAFRASALRLRLVPFLI